MTSLTFLYFLTESIEKWPDVKFRVKPTSKIYGNLDIEFKRPGESTWNTLKSRTLEEAEKELKNEKKFSHRRSR